MKLFSGINVTCDICNFIVDDYVLIQTFINEDESPKNEIICRPCAIKRGLPVAYKGRIVKTIGLFVGD